MRNKQIDLLEEMLIVSNITMQFQGISQEFIYIRKKISNYWFQFIYSQIFNLFTKDLIFFYSGSNLLL